jgi:hypothetical protein
MTWLSAYWLFVMLAQGTAAKKEVEWSTSMISLETIGLIVGMILSTITILGVLLGYHRRIVSKENKFETDISGVGAKVSAQEITLGSHETSIAHLESRLHTFEAEKNAIMKQAAEMKGTLDSIQAEQKFMQQQASKDKLEIMVALAEIKSDIKNLNYR